MAVDATGLWEFQPASGAADNGGGFANLDPGTSVDYSQLASPILVITDGATGGIGSTAFSTANGGLTSAMAGSVMYLQTGVNLIDGWYQLAVIIDGNNATLDRAPDDGGGAVSGADGNVGGALDILTDAFLDDTDVVVPGQTIYVKNDGTMALTGSITVLNDGTRVNPIIIEGYNINRGDTPIGNNRPLISAGSRSFVLDNFFILKNLRITITQVNGVRLDTGGIFSNCSINNLSGTANRTAILLGASNAKMVECEAQSVNGIAVRCTGSLNKIFSSYIHDSNVGMQVSSGVAIHGCVFDTCVTAISDNTVADTLNCEVLGNVLYNGTTGLSINDGYSWTVTNNIIDSFTTGASWTIEQGANFFDRNCWDNTVDVSNVTKGDNAVTADPLLTDPANGDFTLKPGSPCLDAGMQMGAAQGVVEDYKVNIGVDQDDVDGLLVHPGMSGGFRG